MSESPISVADGKLRVLTPNWNRPRIEPERIDEFLNPEFVSRLASRLWDGDNEASVSNALSLIDGCSKELARRKNPLSEISLSGTPQSKSFQRTARFWKRCSLATLIEIVASVGRLRQPDDAIQVAFSIIESTMTMLEKRSEGSVETKQKDFATTPSDQSASRHLGSGLTEHLKPHWSWKEAAKRITGIKRPGRAADRLLRFLNDIPGSKSFGAELKRAIAEREKNGFTLLEVIKLERSYAEWHPRHVKSRQRDSGQKIGRKNLRKRST
jgi:hypothetical protein